MLILPTAARAASATSFARGLGLFNDTDAQGPACTGPGVGHYRYIVIQWYMATSTTCGLARIKAAGTPSEILPSLMTFHEFLEFIGMDEIRELEQRFSDSALPTTDHDRRL